MNTISKLNYASVSDAYAACEDYMAAKGKPVDLVPQVAHKLMLNQQFWAVNSKRIDRIVTGMKSKNDELLQEATIGKLAVKLQSIKIPNQGYDRDFHEAACKLFRMSNFDKVHVRYTMAGILLRIMLDNGVVKERVEFKQAFNAHTKRSFKKAHTYVVFGGVSERPSVLRGFESAPGVVLSKHNGPYRIKPELISLLGEMSSQKFKLSDLYSPERMLHFYRGSTLYHSESKDIKGRVVEGRVKRHTRFEMDYLDGMDKLAALDGYYLPVHPDSRLRLSYSTALYGARIHGKAFETAMHDAYEARVYGPSAIDVCKHIIVDIRYGKMSQKEAVAKFCAKDLTWALAQDPLNVALPDVKYSAATKPTFEKFEKDCSEALVALKAARCIQMTKAGEPCSYMFGQDLTNSGLLMLGNSSRSPQMLAAVNVMGESTVRDSHTVTGTGLGIMSLGRQAVKLISTPLFHGAGYSTIAKKMLEVGVAEEFCTEEYVDDHLIATYGYEIDNIQSITQWGRKVVNNYQNILKWKTLDGHTAFHQSTMERTPFSVCVAMPGWQNSSKKDPVPFKYYNIIATMPYAEDKSGYAIYGKDNVTPESPKGVSVKTYGLFANITHSLDATLLRRIVQHQLLKGEEILVKHDDYIVRPDQFGEIVQVCQKFFSDLQSKNLYQDALDQIAANLKVPATAPTFRVGNAPDLTSQSVNFLLP